MNNNNNDMKSNVFSDNNTSNNLNNVGNSSDNIQNINNNQNVGVNTNNQGITPNPNNSQINNNPMPNMMNNNQNINPNQPINNVTPNNNGINNTTVTNPIPVNEGIAMPKLNSDETVGMIKKDTQKSPIAMLVLFACLIIGIFLIPYITPYLSNVLKIFGIEDNSSIYGNGSNNSNNDTTNIKNDDTKKDDNNNDTKETTYYDILDSTSITFDKLTITNLNKVEENGTYYLNYKIINNDTSNYNFREHKIYFDLYNDDKTYIGRVLIDTDTLNSKEEITLKSILNNNEYTTATKLEVLERTTSDYQSVSLKNNKLTCNGNNHSIIYTFSSNKLTGLDDTYNYTFIVNDEAYAQYALGVQNTVNDLNKITGVSAGFVNTQTGFTKTMKINYSETSENLTKYDRIYYEKDATASTVKYELESIGYKCD